MPAWFMVDCNMYAFTCRASKTSAHPSSPAAAKPVSEASVAPKQVTVSTAPAKQTSAPTPAPASASVAVSALNYLISTLWEGSAGLVCICHI